jgi:glucoamylase
VQGAGPFTLHWSSDNWKSVRDTKSTRNALEIDYVDLADVVTSPGMCIRFTFLWAEANRWEGHDYEVTVR